MKLHYFFVVVALVGCLRNALKHLNHQILYELRQGTINRTIFTDVNTFLKS